MSARGAVEPGDQHLSLTFDGVQRYYDVHVPSMYDGSSPVPLILDFHGFGSNKSQERLVSGWKLLSESEGFIVVYPQGRFGGGSGPETPNPGHGPGWNGGDLCCGDAVTQNVDDVGFARVLVATVSTQFNIDSRRVYATGISNGGAMTNRLACDAADLFAAAAPLAFPVPFDPIDKCTPSRTIPLLYFAGLTDELVPYDGADFFGMRLISARESFEFWRSHNHCGTETPERVDTGDSYCETDRSCADGVEVGLCSILSVSTAPDAGHILYFNNDLILAEVAWQFMSRFTLADAPATADDSEGGGCEIVKPRPVTPLWLFVPGVALLVAARLVRAGKKTT